MRKQLARFSCLMSALVLMSASAAAAPQTKKSEKSASVKGGVSAAVRKAAREGRLLYRLTEPSEVRDLLGEPDEETSDRDGGMRIRHLRYDEARFDFGCIGSDAGPFGLVMVRIGDEPIDIGRERQIVLRTDRDLKKLDSFRGFENVSLAALDLSAQGELISAMPFDTSTEWPAADKLPAGFDPAKTLELGKNPGLGIRALHKRGIDGRGVHVAIIDQPLLLDHSEYVSRIARYDALNVRDAPPQMHGPPVASILIGRTCGVAPGAVLSYFAVPMWKRDNQPFCQALEEIIRRNKSVEPSERTRVVSISTGMFSRQEHYDRWQKVLAEARTAGILVVTCDPQWLRYGTLKRTGMADPDDPSSYQPGKYRSGNDQILVPAGGRSTACKAGPTAYEYWPDGGMSWAAPYLAGIAALAYQVNPEITPDEIVRLWLDTSQAGAGGPMVDPPAFVEAARALRK